jgi:hypothetical protein
MLCVIFPECIEQLENLYHITPYHSLGSGIFSAVRFLHCNILVFGD